MENILILKKVATVSGYASVALAMDGIAIGDLIAVGDDKILLGGNSVIADLAGIQSVQFFTKVSTDTIKASVFIDRENITRYNYQVAKDAVMQVSTLGGITAPLTLVIPSTGNAGIMLRNMSYNHTIASERVSVDLAKKASQTPEQYVDALVAEINEQMTTLYVPFVTVTKVVSGANLGIQFTTTNSNVDFSIATSGFLEGSAYTVNTQPVAPIGAGADVLNLERDFSRNRGNSGYAELNELWYKQPTETSAALKYHMATLKWDGIAETPSTTFKSATNHLQFAVDTTADNGTITVNAFLRLIANVATTAILETDTDATDNA
jgi:hypothetical protein